jgi:TolB-like protein
MLLLALATTLIATPSGTGVPKVLVLDLRVDGGTEEVARTVRDEVAVALGSDARLDVLSSEDVRRVISVDAEKRAIGCTADSCLAEVGSALGARYIVHGSIGAVGSTTVVHLNLFDTEGNRAIARETAEETDINQLLPQVRAATARMRATMLGDSSSLPPFVIVGGVVVGVGVIAAIAGGIAMATAYPAFSDVSGGHAVTDRVSAQGVGQIGTLVLAGGVMVAAGAGAFTALELP